MQLIPDGAHTIEWVKHFVWVQKEKEKKRHSRLKYRLWKKMSGEQITVARKVVPLYIAALLFITLNAKIIIPKYGADTDLFSEWTD